MAVDPFPLRGEVWDVRFPQPVGEHPAVVVAANVLRARLSSVTVAVVTGTVGPGETHVRLDRDSGLTGRRESFVNATDLHTVPLSRFRRRRGLLSPEELHRLEESLRLALEL